MNHRESSMQPVYVIKIKGVLDEKWSDWFSGMALTLEGDVTILTGSVDGSALHGILDRIRDLNLELISVSHVESGSSE